MNKLLKHVTLLLFGLVFGCLARADIVVVVNEANPVSGFSHRELVDLYMGRNLHFPDGSLVYRLDQDPDSMVRKDFYRSLVNKSIGQVTAYWAKLLFTGRATPPQVLNDNNSVLSAVRSNINAIGYIESVNLDNSVKVVARVN
ncbi:hypothetical protein FT643_19715 [Ketobacter sp. MCCC 1A13808]|uniref:hypothetical protein n=1 Tax=Ketobacter sp. MCCC 1A13808 TaxID=2602738 RepID=UPI0012EC6C4E|nr:hypothetical protein [Ketobacter sp. MCCC 1A13808]MVF14368.1 hypothetical protein [Ketobacter sp. MCCC 1A13808]|tara:strand:+ start:78 stop:506 length:429 start_codon:yes stop_codon:yes gene_type:complete